MSLDMASDLTHRIAGRVQRLRASQGLSLEALADRSGVSRSMISLIERGETSPTAVVLERLATGLGVVLATLFDAPDADRAPDPLSRRTDQDSWTDPDSGYTRRNISPPGAGQPMQIVEVRFPPGRRVTFERLTPGPVACQQVWVLSGTLDITLGRTRTRLAEGDCLAMQLDRPITFHNPSRRTTRYCVVIAPSPAGKRT